MLKFLKPFVWTSQSLISKGVKYGLFAGILAAASSALLYGSQTKTGNRLYSQGRKFLRKHPISKLHMPHMAGKRTSISIHKSIKRRKVA